MADSAVPAYRLSEEAVSDLAAIWRYGAAQWSTDHADDYLRDLEKTFRLIGSMPSMARLRTEFDPPVHIHPHRSHLIVYLQRGETVVIIRVLAGRRNWRAILNSDE